MSKNDYRFAARTLGLPDGELRESVVRFNRQCLVSQFWVGCYRGNGNCRGRRFLRRSSLTRVLVRLRIARYARAQLSIRADRGLCPRVADFALADSAPPSLLLWCTNALLPVYVAYRSSGGVVRWFRRSCASSSGWAVGANDHRLHSRRSSHMRGTAVDVEHELLRNWNPYALRDWSANAADQSLQPRFRNRRSLGIHPDRQHADAIGNRRGHRVRRERVGPFRFRGCAVFVRALKPRRRRVRRRRGRRRLRAGSHDLRRGSVHSFRVHSKCCVRSQRLLDS